MNLSEQKAQKLARAKEISESRYDSAEAEAAAEAEFDGLMKDVEGINRSIERQNRLNAELAGMAHPADEAPQPIGRAAASGMTFDQYALARAAGALGRPDLLREAGQQSITDVWVPDVLWGEMKQFLDQRTPLASAVSRRPLPGQTSGFYRTYDLSDVEGGASVVPEYGTVPMTGHDEDKVFVAVEKVAGRKLLSVEAMDLSPFSEVARATANLQLQIAQRTERVIAAKLVAAATEDNTLSLTADAKAIHTALMTANFDLIEATGEPAATVFLSPDRATYIGTLYDEDGRPLFAPVNPMNALGTTPGLGQVGNIAGFRSVVSPYLPTATFIVGATEHLEWYEGPQARMDVNKPSNLSYEFSLYYYVAACFWSQGLINLAP